MIEVGSTKKEYIDKAEVIAKLIDRERALNRKLKYEKEGTETQERYIDLKREVQSIKSYFLCIPTLEIDESEVEKWTT